MPPNATRVRTIIDRWLTDSCEIRAVGTLIFDEDEGIDVATDGGIVYTGQCRIRPLPASSVVLAGEAPVTRRGYLVRLPYDTTGIEVNQIITVTSTDAPHLTDRRLRVTDVRSGSGAGSLLLEAEDVLDVDEGEEEGS